MLLFRICVEIDSSCLEDWHSTNMYVYCDGVLPVFKSDEIKTCTTLSRLKQSMQHLELVEHINPNYVSLSSLFVNLLVFL